MYHVFFCIRRILFVGLAFYCKSPSLQLLFTMLPNLFILMYKGSTRPMASRFSNNLEIFNEYCVASITFCLIWFTDWIENPKLQYLYGFVMILMIAINVVVNFLIVSYFAIKTIYLLALRHKNTFKLLKVIAKYYFYRFKIFLVNCLQKLK